MNQMNYHKTINSFFVQIVRIKYQNDNYIKCHIRYFSKASNLLLAEEKNIKIRKNEIRHWEIWNG